MSLRSNSEAPQEDWRERATDGKTPPVTEGLGGIAPGEEESNCSPAVRGSHDVYLVGKAFPHDPGEHLCLLQSAGELTAERQDDGIAGAFGSAPVKSGSDGRSDPLRKTPRAYADHAESARTSPVGGWKHRRQIIAKHPKPDDDRFFAWLIADLRHAAVQGMSCCSRRCCRADPAQNQSGRQHLPGETHRGHVVATADHDERTQRPLGCEEAELVRRNVADPTEHLIDYSEARYDKCPRPRLFHLDSRLKPSSGTTTKSPRRAVEMTPKPEPWTSPKMPANSDGSAGVALAPALRPRHDILFPVAHDGQWDQESVIL